MGQSSKGGKKVVFETNVGGRIHRTYLIRTGWGEVEGPDLWPERMS